MQQKPHSDKLTITRSCNYGVIQSTELIAKSEHSPRWRIFQNLPILLCFNSLSSPTTQVRNVFFVKCANRSCSNSNILLPCFSFSSVGHKTRGTMHTKQAQSHQVMSPALYYLHSEKQMEMMNTGRIEAFSHKIHSLNMNLLRLTTHKIST